MGFETEESTKKAISELNGHKIENKTLKVELRKEIQKEAKSENVKISKKIVKKKETTDTKHKHLIHKKSFIKGEKKIVHQAAQNIHNKKHFVKRNQERRR